MQPATPNPLINLLPLVIIFVIFYYLLIRPQKLSQKEHQKMIENLNKNDEIVTTGGLHGKIINLKEKTLILRIDENVKVEIEKNCVAYLKKQ
ncbi:MAG: preprotein translocase subunit YajC [Candidatus Omnitrophota bacterium]|jgi:preprotein translocase subunit YajC